MDRVIGLITCNYASEELGELTEERTVASLPFGGRYRLLDFPLSNMVNSGISTVGIITPYKYRSIIDHVGAGKEWDLDRKHGGLFILPGSVFGINTPGARFTLRDIARNAVYFNRSQAPYVLVSAASTVCNVDYTDFITQHIRSGADISLMYAPAPEDDRSRLRINAENGRVTGTVPGVKKGEDAFLDCFIISRSLLLKIIEWYAAINYLDFFEVLASDYDKMDVRAYRFDGFNCTVSTVSQYYRDSMELLKREVFEELFINGGTIVSKIQDCAPTKYLKGSRVHNSLLPNGCVIEGTVENSILFRGVEVRRGAAVRNSIIMQACVIEEGAVVENAIIDRSNVIGAGTIIKGSAESTFVKEKHFA